MFGKRFGYIHGWIEGVQASVSGDGCLLRVRIDSAQTILLSTFRPDWPVKPGNEISAAVRNSHPSHAVALIDHTAGDGAILPCSGQRHYWESVVIATALLGLTLAVSGWKGLPVFVLLMVTHGLARYWFPEAIRRRDVGRISYTIDTDYRRWLEERV
jgi:hypothetical protein